MLHNSPFQPPRPQQSHLPVSKNYPTPTTQKPPPPPSSCFLRVALFKSPPIPEHFPNSTSALETLLATYNNTDTGDRFAQNTKPPTLLPPTTPSPWISVPRAGPASRVSLPSQFSRSGFCLLPRGPERNCRHPHLRPSGTAALLDDASRLDVANRGPIAGRDLSTDRPARAEARTHTTRTGFWSSSPGLREVDASRQTFYSYHPCNNSTGPPEMTEGEKNTHTNTQKKHKKNQMSGNWSSRSNAQKWVRPKRDRSPRRPPACARRPLSSQQNRAPAT